MEDKAREYREVLYIAPTSIEKQMGFYPLRVGRNVAKSNYYVGPRSISSYSLHFVLEGRGLFFQNGLHYELNKGDLFCLFPGTMHQYGTDAAYPLRMIWFAFDGKQALPILNRIGIRLDSPHLPGIINEAMVPDLEMLLEQTRQPLAPNSELLRLSSILRLFHNLSLLCMNEDSRNDPNSPDWLEKGLQYMNLHFAAGITIDETAAFAGVDRTHFSKTFKKAYGSTPVNYLQALKMKEAAQMLVHTQFKMSEVALSVGFPDLYSFSRAFKNYYGVAPSQYQNHMR